MDFDKNEELFSRKVRAGKRTYFFDVKATRSSDYYITITESKRKPKGDGFIYEKHKIFLYREDFSKFAEALNETCEFIESKSDELPPLHRGHKDTETEVKKEDDSFQIISDEDGLSWD